MNVMSCFTMLFIRTVLVLIISNYCSGGIFSWMFRKYEGQSIGDSNNRHSPTSWLDSHLKPATNEKEDVINTEDTKMDHVKIPFEMKSSDEKFMTEVSKYTSIVSKLDVCHHEVVLGLKKSCSDLTEEELSKIAVNVLNCQSAVEERPIFPCTNEMTLQECTRRMDPNTWNAYHIISNRVRAVCYHFRQQQFTVKTEMTVNKLVTSAEEQIDAMKLLEESQKVLKDATSDTLNSLSTGHQILQKQQEELSSAHMNIHSYVSSNIRDLTREKRLIASGQRELAQITISIKRKLEEAQKQMSEQGIGQRTTHKKILHDLSDIQDSANLVWGQIDQSMKTILEKHEQTVDHYAKLMTDLQKINATVHHVMDISLKMKQKVEEKFSWLSSIMGDTDATVQKIYSFILHLCYCFVGMVSATFLQVPYATRIALIILVPLNAISEMKNDISLHFSTLTVVLAVCMFFNLTTIGAIQVYRWRKHNKVDAVSGCTSMPLNTSLCDKSYVKMNGSFHLDKSTDCNGGNLTQISKCDEGSYSSDDDQPRRGITPKKSFLNASHSFVSPLSSILEDKDDSSSDSTSKYRSVTSSLDPKISAFQSPTVTNEYVRRRLLSEENISSSLPATLPSLNESFGFRRPSSRLDRSRSSTPVRESLSPHSQSFTSKAHCIAITKKGLPCKLTASIGSFCLKHQHGLSRETTPIR